MIEDSLVSLRSNKRLFVVYLPINEFCPFLLLKVIIFSRISVYIK